MDEIAEHESEVEAKGVKYYMKLSLLLGRIPWIS